MKELRSKRLHKDEVDLWAGNRTRIITLVVEIYYLTLPSGLILKLDNCYFILVLFRNIVSDSYLTFNKFKFIIEGNFFSFHNNDVYYGSSIYMNDLYILDFEMLMFKINLSQIYELSQINLILWDFQKNLLDIISTIPIKKKRYLSQNMLYL
jgi:hypothetical protein